MDNKTFRKFADLIYKRCGICLSDNKMALLTARTKKRMRILNIFSYKDYLDYVTNKNNEAEITNLVDAISTNVTSFFREATHFTFMEEVFRAWLNTGQKKFRIWSAACSTGEEPYTIAITLKEIEEMNNFDIDVKILATDISTKVLETAKIGVYQKDKVKQVSPLLVDKYFNRIHQSDKKFIYEIKDEIKKMITFKRLDITKVPYPMKGPLDIVFCRNVMIYFDKTTKERLVNGIYDLLKLGGCLCVGHAESLTGIDHKFKYVKPAVYQK
ncbi:MAG: protein-glutamate O-methyltransferase CheR [Candidatus Aureabacteria bacterium]|nr:protein-glutamate O-methyltransferase CheR [Candidatus Auribacterota bacterium]